MRRLIWLGILACVAPTLGQGRSRPRDVARRAPMVVGWHDEMNDPARWRPIGSENAPDIYSEKHGVLSLRLPHVPGGYRYAYQWSGVTRSSAPTSVGSHC